MGDGTLETHFLNFLTDYITRTALQKESGPHTASCAMSLRGLSIGQILGYSTTLRTIVHPLVTSFKIVIFGMFSLLDGSPLLFMQLILPSNESLYS